VEFVREGLGERVVEYRRGLAKRNAVFFEVGSGFVRVELEAQGREVHALVAGAILARAGAAGACARCPHLRIGIWGARF
jgi:hypothetical protein